MHARERARSAACAARVEALMQTIGTEDILFSPTGTGKNKMLAGLVGNMQMASH
jgi:hypothetical protein